MLLSSSITQSIWITIFRTINFILYCCWVFNRFSLAGFILSIRKHIIKGHHRFIFKFLIICISFFSELLWHQILFLLYTTHNSWWQEIRFGILGEYSCWTWLCHLMIRTVFATLVKLELLRKCITASTLSFLHNLRPCFNYLLLDNLMKVIVLLIYFLWFFIIWILFSICFE